MTYPEAQTEFLLRLYRWAKAAQEKELLEGFPRFKHLDEELARTFLFFRSLDPRSQMLLARGRLMVRHKEAAKALGEEITLEVQTLMRREEAFRLRQLPGTWEGRFAQKNEADMPKLATRKQLKKSMLAQFGATFGDQCLPVDPLENKTDPEFRMKYKGWVICTGFNFGRWDPEIGLSQGVWNGHWITKEQPTVLFANSLRIQMSYGAEIGFCSDWREIAVEDIEPTCAEVIEHCRRMFDALPALLDGLELESLTA